MTSLDRFREITTIRDVPAGTGMGSAGAPSVSSPPCTVINAVSPAPRNWPSGLPDEIERVGSPIRQQ